MMEDSHEQIPIDFHPDWIFILNHLKDQFGKKPNLETILFLIGTNELGKGPIPFTKEQKQDLMHIATCKLLSYDGYYAFIRMDEDGWPFYEIQKPIPVLSNEDQEFLMKKNIIRYFKEIESP